LHITSRNALNLFISPVVSCEDLGWKVDAKLLKGFEDTVAVELTAADAKIEDMKKNKGDVEVRDEMYVMLKHNLIVFLIFKSLCCFVGVFLLFFVRCFVFMFFAADVNIEDIRRKEQGRFRSARRNVFCCVFCLFCFCAHWHTHIHTNAHTRAHYRLAKAEITRASAIRRILLVMSSFLLFVPSTHYFLPFLHHLTKKLQAGKGRDLRARRRQGECDEDV
jgi:hypothetical protein